MLESVRRALYDELQASGEAEYVVPGVARSIRTIRSAAALFFAAALAGQSPAADRLILRNLDILTDRTVTALDEDGLVLDASRPGGAALITWDEVERGTIALDQARFDELLKSLGPPLYRIRQRLKIGDYEALAEPAELLYPRFAERQSQTAYMVCQATMWSRLADGRREAAVEPYLRSLELLRSGAAPASGLPGERQLPFEAKTGLSPDFLPVWFDADAAKAELAAVQQAIRRVAQPRPEGVYVYYASLALAAGETAEAQRVLPSIRGEDPLCARWREILLAEQEVRSGSPGPNVAALGESLDSLPPVCRPAALYWLGLAGVQSADEASIKDGILHLLAIAAAHPREQPELAAAGLYHAAAALDKLKDGPGAAAVRYELTSQYGGTYFGAKATGKPEARSTKSETSTHEK
jgi:hypothetical protein